MQLFGSKPEQFAGAARAVSEHVGSKLDAININMACPRAKGYYKGRGLSTSRATCASPRNSCRLRCQLQRAGDGEDP